MTILTEYNVPGPQRFRVVGLDLSVTSTGMSDGTAHWVTQPAADQPIEKRMAQIVASVESFLYRDGYSGRPDLVVIEAGAFSRGAQSEAAEWLAGLRYLVRVMLSQHGFPFAMVGIKTLKAYTTGNGSATKRQMVAAVQDRHGIDLSNVLVKDGRYDMADAIALAAMGYAYLNDPMHTEGPPPPMRSLLAVKWPSHPRPYVEGE